MAKRRVYVDGEQTAINSVLTRSPLIKRRVEYEMATANKHRKPERKSVDLNQRAEDLQREIERLETTLGPSVVPYPKMSTNNTDPRCKVGT